MPIDLASVSWLYVTVLAVIVFVSALVGNLLSFRNRVRGALLTAIVFAGLFVFWTYYPHHVPLPTTPTEQKAAVAPPSPASPATPAAPAAPRNPVTDVTPPEGSTR